MGAAGAAVAGIAGGGLLARGMAGSPPRAQERDNAEEYAKTLRIQREMLTGTGRFSDLGPLVDLEREQRPKWMDLEADTLERAADRLLPTYAERIQPQLSAMEAAANRYQREADISAVEEFGQRATAATLGADPKLREALDLATDRAIAGMDKKHDLRRFREGVRGAQTARGMAYSPFAAAEESYFSGLEQEARDQRRMAQLQGVIGQRASFVNPWQQVLGRPGQTFSAMGGFGGQASNMSQSLGSKIYQPESQYSADLYAGNAANQMAAQQAGAMHRASIMNAGLGFGGSMMKAYSKDPGTFWGG